MNNPQNQVNYSKDKTKPQSPVYNSSPMKLTQHKQHLQQQHLQQQHLQQRHFPQQHLQQQQ